MINSIVLNNFQSHASTRLDLHQGVNVIIGGSDQGKSAILRGFNWVYSNKPGGTGYISKWIKTPKGSIKKGQETSVSLFKGEKEIKRFRNEKNGYIVDGKHLEAIGSDVPEEVSNFLNLGDVNIQKQLDSPFLISYTSGEVSRFFNKLVDLETIDKTISLSGSKKRATTASIKVAEKALAEHVEKLEAYDWIDSVEKKLVGLEGLEKRKIEVTSKYNKLSRLSNEIDRLEERIRENEKRCHSEERVVELLSKSSSYVDVSKQVVRLNRCVLSIEKSEVASIEASKVISQESRVGELDCKVQVYNAKRIERDSLNLQFAKCETAMSVLEEVEFVLQENKLKAVDSLENSIKDWQTQKTLRDSLFKIYNRVEKLTTIIDYNKVEIEKLEKSLPDSCPLCGGAME